MCVIKVTSVKRESKAEQRNTKLLGAGAEVQISAGKASLTR